MEQGKKKLISGADEFVKERKDQLEKEQQQKDNAQKEKGQQDEEFHKTQALQTELFLKNEQRMVSERARLHGEQHEAQQQAGVRVLPPENQLGDSEQQKELAPRNDALANDAHRGSFAENQMRAQAESRAEFEKSEGKVLVTCAEKPEDVKPLPAQPHMQREGTTSAPSEEQSQARGRSM